MTRDWPPHHVTIIKDRHGKKRYRYRRSGVPSRYINFEPKSHDFWALYDELENSEAEQRKEVSRRFAPHSMDDLAAKVRRSPKWKQMQPRGQHVKGAIIDRLLDRKNSAGVRFGARDARKISVASLDKILGGMSHGTAGNFRKEMKRLFGYAQKLGWRADNPALATDVIKGGKGWHTWTDAEIEQYRAHHELGTTARLVLELALNTAARRCNLHDMERSAIANDRIEVHHAKGNNVTRVKVMPELREALDAMPATHIRYLIVGAHGKPYTVQGLGEKMRRWCRYAGIPHCTLHGLRKARSRQLAETGATDAQGRAVTGHKKDSTFAYYAQLADREALADAALSNLAAAKIVQP